jgi:hypothetical protein
VEYLTELVIDEEEPYRETEAAETGNGPLRRVYVFKFHPLSGDEAPVSRSKLDEVLEQRVAEVAIEKRWTEKFFVNPSAEEYEAERREQALVLDFEDYLRRRGHDAARLKIVPVGEMRPMFCDVYDKTAGVLIEAQGTVASPAKLYAWQSGSSWITDASLHRTAGSPYSCPSGHVLTSWRCSKAPAFTRSGQRTASSMPKFSRPSRARASG